MKLSRRVFLSGLGAGLGAAKVNLTLADMAAYKGSSASAPPTLVNVFLRGGMDGLSFMPPRTGVNYTNYELLRPDLRVADSDSLNIGGGFGLHPNCGGMHSLFQSGDLALIHAVGHPPDAHSRSHFDSMQYIELGTPGDITTNTGWLTRHLQTAPNLPGETIMQALASSTTPPASLLGRLNLATIESTGNFHPNSGTFEDTHLVALQQLYAGAGSLDQAVTSAVDAVQLIASLDLDNYVPGGGAVYPDGSFGDDLAMIAQLIREDLGVAVATVDFGGWDDHTSLVGNFSNRIEILSDALNAFYTDLNGSGYGQKVVVVVQTEFGRRVRENDDNGVDHGSGAPMAIIGGAQVAGGQIHGEFPGLGGGDLLDGEDVFPLIDYRQVLSEVLVEMLGNPNIDIVFPGFSYEPLGAVKPDKIFDHSFE